MRTKDKYLLIDTAEETSRVLLLNNDFVQGNVASTNLKTILPIVKKILGKGKKSVSLKGVVSVVGPGEFSKVRQGVVWSNTLAWAMALPLKGISIGDHIRSGRWSKKAVSPIYNRPPNIT